MEYKHEIESLQEGFVKMESQIQEVLQRLVILERMFSRHLVDELAHKL